MDVSQTNILCIRKVVYELRVRINILTQLLIVTQIFMFFRSIFHSFPHHIAYLKLKNKFERIFNRYISGLRNVGI